MKVLEFMCVVVSAYSLASEVSINGCLACTTYVRLKYLSIIIYSSDCEKRCLKTEIRVTTT